MTDVHTFHATATYDGTYWVVGFDNLPKGMVASTQGRTWVTAHAMAVDAATLLLDVSPGDVEVVMHPSDPELANLVDKAKAAQNSADEAKAKASKCLSEAAQELTKKYTVRDAASMLGFSHQHIAKLAPKN